MRPQPTAVRIWPYGTAKPCTVLASDRTARFEVVTVQDHGERPEAFVCVYRRGHLARLPAVGDRGRIVFVRGGEMGGYWQWEAGKP